MTKLLYIGNRLHKHGLNKTTIETLGENLKKEGFDVVAVSDKKSFIFRLWEMIWATLTTSNIDYILIDTYSAKAYWYAVICSQIARLRRIKYIPILHGGNLPIRLKNSAVSSTLLFKNAYLNVAPSSYLKHEFNKEGFQNIKVIPNTLEILKYQFKERNNIQPKLLWVRAFAKIYNPEMAIKVFSEIKKQYSNATLTMVGPDKDGSLKKCQDLASQLDIKVHFTGQLSKEDWWKLSEDCDIFINTTNFDNTPVSVMEVMALGLPIVSTNVGGIPFLLEDKKTALLVNSDNFEEMTNAILETIKNQTETRERIVQARQVVELFSWDYVKLQWREVLEKY